MATAGASATGTATAYVHAKVQLDAPDGDIKLGLEANVVIATGEAKGVLSLPISVITLGIFYLVVNTLMLYIAAWLANGLFGAGFYIASFGSAFVASIVISLVSALVNGLIGNDA